MGLMRQISNVKVEGKVDKRRFSKLQGADLANALEIIKDDKSLEKRLR